MTSTRKCVVRTCGSQVPHKSSTQPKKAFFRLPVKDPVRLAKFIEFTDEPALKGLHRERLISLRICEDHFEPYFIIRHYRTTLLSNAALPTLNQRLPSEIDFQIEVSTTPRLVDLVLPPVETKVSEAPSCDYDTASSLRSSVDVTTAPVNGGRRGGSGNLRKSGGGLGAPALPFLGFWTSKYCQTSTIVGASSISKVKSVARGVDNGLSDAPSSKCIALRNRQSLPILSNENFVIDRNWLSDATSSDLKALFNGERLLSNQQHCLPITPNNDIVIDDALKDTRDSFESKCHPSSAPLPKQVRSSTRNSILGMLGISRRDLNPRKYSKLNKYLEQTNKRLRSMRQKLAVVKKKYRILKSLDS